MEGEREREKVEMQSRVSRRYTAVFTRPSRSLWTWQRYLRGINEPGNRVQRNYLSFSHRGQIRAIVTRDPRVEDRSGDSIGIDRSSLKRERSRSRSRATASVLTSAGLQPLVYYSCPGLNRDWQRIWFRPLFGRFWKPYREFSTCFSCNQRKIKIVAFFSRLLFRPVIGYFWLRMRVRLEQMIFPRLVTRFSVTRRKKGAWRTKKKKKRKTRCYLSASQPSELLILEYTMEILKFIGLYVELASLQIYHVIYLFVYCKRPGLFRICMYMYVLIHCTWKFDMSVIECVGWTLDLKRDTESFKKL